MARDGGAAVGRARGGGRGRAAGRGRGRRRARGGHGAGGEAAGGERRRRGAGEGAAARGSATQGGLGHVGRRGGDVRGRLLGLGDEMHASDEHGGVSATLDAWTEGVRDYLFVHPGGG